MVLFKDSDDNYEIEAVITKRVKDKNFVLNNLLNGEDIEDYIGRRKLNDNSHY